MRYRPEIDGLRALAVIPVILFHAGFKFISGGFVGVDIFFVISGYLITSILFSELDDGNFSLVKFYERRTRRILPALLFVMAVCVPFAWLLMDPFEFKEFSQSVVSTTSFSSNIYFYLKSGYFDTTAELKPLLHTWSLAVEEQYYIFFPLLLMLSWRIGKRQIFAVLVVVGALSLGLAHWLSKVNQMAAFYMLPTRGWELILGSFAAFYFNKIPAKRPSIRLSTFLSVLGISLIVFSILWYDKNTPFPSLYALPPTIGTLLVIVFTHHETGVRRFLSNRFMVGIGVLSYSGYLWHQPILAFARIYNIGELSIYQSILAIIATFMLAYATKIFVEDKFRHSLFKTNRNGLFLTAFIASAFICAFGIFGHITNGLPGRSDEGLRLAQNFGISDRCSGADIRDESCRTSKNPSVMIWGDSFSMHLTNAINKAVEGGVIQSTLSACPPIVNFQDAPVKSTITCYDFNNNIAKYLQSTEGGGVKAVFLSTIFSFKDRKAQAMFVDTLRMLKKLGIDVVIISPTPIFTETLRCIKTKFRQNVSTDSCQYDVEAISNKNTFDFLSGLALVEKVKFIDLREFICPERICHASLNDVLLFRDSGHLSNESTSLVADFLRGKLKSH